MKLLSFDIEISDEFDLKPGEELDQYAPFHISIASTAIQDGEEILWYSVDDNGIPLLNMTKEKARELLAYLSQQRDAGYMISAWNGLKFDLRWIGHVAEDIPSAAKLALKIYDPMFQFFNQRGFPVSLGAVAKAMGIEQTKLMDGADAPKEWRAGHYEAVMNYVMGDSQITNKILSAIVKLRRIRWVAQSGQTKTEPMPKLKTVAEVLRDPEPDQSWMRNPMRRDRFIKWLPQSTLEDSVRDDCSQRTHPSEQQNC